MSSAHHRVVVVTGASAGVGRAAARCFARNGADVALLARGGAGLDAAAAEVEALGRRSLAIEVDTADAAGVDDAAARVTDALGPIDVWVNDAFSSVFAPFREIAPDEFRRITEVTYLGFVNGTRAALARMRARGRGTIVQVGSALAGRAVVWAAEHRRREWWVGASTAATLVANAVVPGLLDRHLARTGFDSQQTGQPADEDRPANLWAPVDADADRGTHGAFDARAHDRSVQWALTRHRRSVLAAGAGLAAVVAWRAARR